MEKVFSGDIGHNYKSRAASICPFTDFEQKTSFGIVTCTLLPR